MSKKKKFASLYMNLENIELLDNFDNDSNIEDFKNAVMDVFKTPILLRTMARLIESEVSLSLKKVMAQEINYRMMQILAEEDSSENTTIN